MRQTQKIPTVKTKKELTLLKFKHIVSSAKEFNMKSY